MAKKRKIEQSSNAVSSNNAIEDNKKTELYDIALLHNRSLAKRFEKRK